VPSALVDGGPRERLWVRGPGALSDVELLALLLGTGRPGASALHVARELLDAGGLRALRGRCAAHLARRKGIGQAKAARLAAALELGRRALEAPLTRGATLSDPDAVAAIYGPRLLSAREHFVVVHLDSRQRVLGESMVAQGSSDRCPVPVREIFSAALEQSARAIICVHNHPSGDPEPSEEDRQLTRRLAEAGALVGIPLLDHVVVAGVRHSSLRARGLLPHCAASLAPEQRGQE